MCSSILEERVARIFMVTEFFEVDGEVSRKGNCIKYLGSLQRFWLFKAVEKEEGIDLISKPTGIECYRHLYMVSCPRTLTTVDASNLTNSCHVICSWDCV